jgi:hypothetical protein
MYRIGRMHKDGGRSGRIQGSHDFRCNDGAFTDACDHYPSFAAVDALYGFRELFIQQGRQMMNGITFTGDRFFCECQYAFAIAQSTFRIMCFC